MIKNITGSWNCEYFRDLNLLRNYKNSIELYLYYRSLGVYDIFKFIPFFLFENIVVFSLLLRNTFFQNVSSFPVFPL